MFTFDVSSEPFTRIRHVLKTDRLQVKIATTQLAKVASQFASNDEYGVIGSSPETQSLEQHYITCSSSESTTPL